MTGERGDCYASEMTIREKIEAMAMQAWISGLALRQGYSDEAAANEASRLAGISADALLANLAKPQEITP